MRKKRMIFLQGALYFGGGGDSGGESDSSESSSGDNGWEGNPSAEEGSPDMPDYADTPGSDESTDDE